MDQVDFVNVEGVFPSEGRGHVIKTLMSRMHEGATLFTDVKGDVYRKEPGDENKKVKRFYDSDGNRYRLIVNRSKKSSPMIPS